MMIVARREFLAAVMGGVLQTVQSPVARAGQSPVAPADLRPGEHPLGLGSDRDGLIYVPRGYTPGVPMPLVVLLHGFAGNRDSSRSRFPLADELGFIILAPDSRDERTWDELLGAFGPDEEFIGASLRYVLGRFTVDPRHVALAGVSDGASYALSLGIGNGDIFSHLIAFSAAFVLPARVRGKPRIFISHGTQDQVMPIDATGRDVVRRLKALGYDVTYREFIGGHTVPTEVSREAFEWFRK
jgi:phospholipase/carboxylesterase